MNRNPEHDAAKAPFLPLVQSARLTRPLDELAVELTVYCNLKCRMCSVWELKEHGVEFQELTSGKYKRTVSLLGEMSEEGVAKTQEMLDATHGLFKSHVEENRPGVDIEAVSTGEYWYAKQAIELGLVDRIATSDDVLMGLQNEARLLLVSVRHDRRIADRLLGIADSGLSFVDRWGGR